MKAKNGFERTEAIDYTASMTTVLEIEQAIEKLPQKDYGEFRQWLENYELEQDTVAASAMVAQMLDEEDGGASQLTGE